MCLCFCPCEVGKTGLMQKLNKYQFPSIFLLVSFLSTRFFKLCSQLGSFRETPLLQQQSTGPFLCPSFCCCWQCGWRNARVGRVVGVRIVWFFLFPLTPLPLFLSMLLWNDTEKLNLLPLYLVNTLLPWELGKRPFLWLSSGMPLPTGPMVCPSGACALPSGTPSGQSGYWISLPQRPKPASRACLGPLMGLPIEGKRRSQ